MTSIVISQKDWAAARKCIREADFPRVKRVTENGDTGWEPSPLAFAAAVFGIQPIEAKHMLLTAWALNPPGEYPATLISLEAEALRQQSLLEYTARTAVDAWLTSEAWPLPTSADLRRGDSATERVARVFEVGPGADPKEIEAP